MSQYQIKPGVKVEVVRSKYHSDHCGMWYFAGVSRNDILLHSNQAAAEDGEYTLAMHYSRVNWLV